MKCTVASLIFQNVNLQSEKQLNKYGAHPNNVKQMHVMHAWPYGYDELTRSVPLANLTEPVYIPDYYRMHFPEDNSLTAPNVYVLSFSYISGGSAIAVSWVVSSQAPTCHFGSCNVISGDTLPPIEGIRHYT
ncbi:hypothetical protein PIB30_074446 [Stylosanthes scabra]|uniref:Uncharacterized protein n=1 Tax=Stylosanthes scabra TaxID=79078 RepID=A0ABU6YNN4_9FABA|nr:hypothetical protein [Stylosanthes scabra]